jgi:hypothetical protein
MLRAISYAPSFNEAVGTTEPYRGTDHTVAVMIQLAKGLVDPRAMVQNALQGERSIRFRRHTEQIINNLRPKDYTSEIIAISRWWGNAGRYTRDPLHVEMIRSPDRLLDDALAGRLLVDCFPEGTLVLRDDYTFLPIEHARPGDKIWGYDRWSTITAHADKGELVVDAIKLNNGSWLRLTPDHKVYVRHCAKHPDGVRSSGKAGMKPCWCRERETKRIPVSELREGHVLLVPERIPFGTGEMDWRLSTRVQNRSDSHAPKDLRVKEIVRNAGTARCYDISTDDHYVYLPEHDVTVSNCDDLATAIATSCMTIGARAQFVTVGFKPRQIGQPKVHTHVFCRAQDPKSKVWWVLDPVAGRKTADMLRRVRQYTIFEVD